MVNRFIPSHNAMMIPTVIIELNKMLISFLGLVDSNNKMIIKAKGINTKILTILEMRLGLSLIDLSSILY